MNLGPVPPKSNAIRVGVVMPTYNQQQYLAAALRSYEAQLYRNSRLVVVDDASTDTTFSILAGWMPKLTVIKHQTNQKTGAAINTGIDALKDDPSLDAFTWISSDNTMTVDWLGVLTSEMDKHNAGVVYSGFTYIRPNLPPNPFRRYAILFKPYDRTRLIKDLNCFFGPSFIIRKDVWLEAGPHRGRLAHDYDHWLRVEEVCWKKNLPIVGINRSLCNYLAHDKRATVVRAEEYDAPYWRDSAIERREGKKQP